jgi:nitrite reductase/ring-hydroxylating ferredoxin subunit
MHYKQTKFFFFAILLCLAASCERNDNPLPRVPVDFYIYPNDVSYLNLNYYGGHEYVTGGVNGIIVFRINEDSFSAFDRACPHDWDHADEPRVFVEDNRIILTCEKCGSQYNILDGSVITGPSKYILKQYRTHYDGWSLRVRN